MLLALHIISSFLAGAVEVVTEMRDAMVREHQRLHRRRSIVIAVVVCVMMQGQALSGFSGPTFHGVGEEEYPEEVVTLEDVSPTLKRRQGVLMNNEQYSPGSLGFYENDMRAGKCACVYRCVCLCLYGCVCVCVGCLCVCVWAACVCVCVCVFMCMLVCVVVWEWCVGCLVYTSPRT